MVDYVQNKSWDTLIACYFDVMVDWEINNPEAKQKGEWVASAVYKKCKEMFLKDTY